MFVKNLFTFKPKSIFVKSVVTDSPNIYKLPGVKKSAKFEFPQYGGRRLASLIPGTGNGPEMAQYVIDTYRLAQVPVDFEVIEGDNVLEKAVVSLQRNGAGIKGDLEDPETHATLNPSLRQLLDLYVYCVHYRSYPNVPTRHPRLDVIVIKQNTFDWHGSLEHTVREGIVESIKATTRENVKKLATWAFKFTKENHRNKITVVHDTHHGYLIPPSVQLYLDTTKSVATKYPDIRTEFTDIGTLCMKLTAKPTVFDVLLLTNLHGASISHIICGLLGGPGMFSAQNYSDSYAVFETATWDHTTTPGPHKANPVANLRASADLLQFFGLVGHARIIEDAITTCLIQNNIKTPDIGGTNTTEEVMENIQQFIKKRIGVYKKMF